MLQTSFVTGCNDLKGLHKLCGITFTVCVGGINSLIKMMPQNLVLFALYYYMQYVMQIAIFV
jgi:hypothetical protein